MKLSRFKPNQTVLVKVAWVDVKNTNNIIGWWRSAKIVESAGMLEGTWLYECQVDVGNGTVICMLVEDYNILESNR